MCKVSFQCPCHSTFQIRFKSNLTVTFFDPVPPEVHVYPQQHATARENGTLSLYCNATGSPAPTLSWTREGCATKLSHNNSLSIARVRKEASGTYVCTASNEGGRASATVAVDVQCKWPAEKWVGDEAEIEMDKKNREIVKIASQRRLGQSERQDSSGDTEKCRITPIVPKRLHKQPQCSDAAFLLIPLLSCPSKRSQVPSRHRIRPSFHSFRYNGSSRKGYHIQIIVTLIWKYTHAFGSLRVRRCETYRGTRHNLWYHVTNCKLDRLFFQMTENRPMQCKTHWPASRVTNVHKKAKQVWKRTFLSLVFQSSR